MRLSGQMILAAVTLWLALAAAARSSSTRPKQPRATRGFKNTEMMTARGFGKRGLAALQHAAHQPPNAGIVNLTPNDNFLDILETQQQDGPNMFEQLDEKPESVPIDWFVDELLNNPELTRTIVRKYIDVNQDGMITPDELLRNSAY